MTYASLKHETRTRRVAKNKQATEHINKIAMRATIDNAVSVMNLTKVVQFVQNCLEQGASDADAEAAARKYIQQLEGYPVE